MSVVLTKTNKFVLNIGSKVFNLATDQLKLALTDTLPVVGTVNQYSDLSSPLADSGFIGTTPFNLTTTSYTQTGGIVSLIVADLTLTANATLSPFRYVVVYDDTATNKEIIGFYDYGSEVVLNLNDIFKADFDNVNGLLQIA